MGGRGGGRLNYDNDDCDDDDFDDDNDDYDVFSSSERTSNTIVTRGGQ